jgi:hypothetical protein
MIRHAPSPLIVAVLLALAFPSDPAQAQLARTYVSSVIGSDANNCDRLTPCRTFQRAHDTTLPSGEITVLDPGGYGAVAITKNISIINDGVGEAGVLVSGGGIGILINAGAADAVSLRGLTIKGIGYGGGNGIYFNSGKSLSVEHCAIRNLTGDAANGLGYGIKFLVWGGSSSLTVSNTLVADNGFIGIAAYPLGSGTTAQVLLNHVALSNNDYGLKLDTTPGTGTIKATVKDSVAAGNNRGFHVEGSATASLMLIHSVATNNGYGVYATGPDTPPVVRIGRSTLTGNAIGWYVFGAVLRSYGDNRIDGNGDGGMPPLTIVKK